MLLDGVQWAVSRSHHVRIDEALAAEVDQQVPIPAGSPMEVEIRAATVWADELMRQALQVRAPGLTAAHVDF
jgi:hypothetical protein